MPEGSKFWYHSRSNTSFPSHQIITVTKLPRIDEPFIMVVENPTAIQSILAGGISGGLEAFITYPTEYIKTRQQLVQNTSSPASPLFILRNAVRNEGVRSMYTGSGVLCFANTLKSAVRFFTFDTVRNHLPRDKSGRQNPLGTMFAGLLAGIAEGATVVTPGENLKTKLIDGRGGQLPSTRQVLAHIVRSQGISGLYRGVVPVTMKQSANAVVRFTSYGFLLDAYRQSLGHNTSTSNAALVVAMAGATSGVITVYATMPFDNVKTRMQAISGGTEQYRGSLDCLRHIVARDGLKGLWRGTTPRLVRLSISSTLSFSIYEQVVSLTRRHDRGEGFIASKVAI